MLTQIKNSLHWIIYTIGIIIYFPIIINGMLPLGTIWLIFILYAWLIVATILGTYNLSGFIYTICFSGILIAISIFFVSGIEEVPFPEGAIIFKIEGVAQALFIFFIFSLPIILLNNNIGRLKASWNQPNNPSKQNHSNQDIEKDSMEDEEWEEATIEDLESGSYETI